MYKQAICLLFVILGFCQSKNATDFLIRCAIDDSKCLVRLWNGAVEELAKGRPEINVVPLDPMKVEDVIVTIPSLVELVFNGTLKGVKDCQFEKVKTAIKKGHFKAALGLNCPLIYIKGHYKSTASGSIFPGLDGDKLVKGDGDGRIHIKNMKISFLLDFIIEKDVEGVTKFILKPGPVAYTHQIKGPVTFEASNVNLAGEDISETINSFMNINWRFIMKVFGKPFVDRAMNIIGDFMRSFFLSVPASAYFIDDIEPYVA